MALNKLTINILQRLQNYKKIEGNKSHTYYTTLYKI